MKYEVRINGVTNTATDDINVAGAAFQRDLEQSMVKDTPVESVEFLLHDENKFIKIIREMGTIKPVEAKDGTTK